MITILRFFFFFDCGYPGCSGLRFSFLSLLLYNDGLFNLLNFYLFAFDIFVLSFDLGLHSFDLFVSFLVTAKSILEPVQADSLDQTQAKDYEISISLMEVRRGRSTLFTSFCLAVVEYSSQKHVVYHRPQNRFKATLFIVRSQILKSEKILTRINRYQSDSYDNKMEVPS